MSKDKKPKKNFEATLKITEDDLYMTDKQKPIENVLREFIEKQTHSHSSKDILAALKRTTLKYAMKVNDE